MRRTLFNSRIDRIAVTAVNPDFESAIVIDRDLLEAADILPHEQIHVGNITRGTHFITYARPGDRSTGIVQVHGGGDLVGVGDILAVTTYAVMSVKRAKKHQPRVVQVDELNRVLAGGTPATVPVTPPMGTAPTPRRRRKQV